MHVKDTKRIVLHLELEGIPNEATREEINDFVEFEYAQTGGVQQSNLVYAASNKGDIEVEVYDWDFS